MRYQIGVSLFLAAASLAGMLAGCGRGNEQSATTPPGPTGPASAAALGTAQTAGHFQVTLSTDPAAPKTGDTRLKAKVTHDGQPVTDATVSVSLSMPSMKMAGPDVTLKPAGDHYEGAANLGMAGEWEAKVTVSAGGETGSTTYRFSAGS